MGETTLSPHVRKNEVAVTPHATRHTKDGLKMDHRPSAGAEAENAQKKAQQ